MKHAVGTLVRFTPGFWNKSGDGGPVPGDVGVVSFRNLDGEPLVAWTSGGKSWTEDRFLTAVPDAGPPGTMPDPAVVALRARRILHGMVDDIDPRQLRDLLVEWHLDAEFDAPAYEVAAQLSRMIGDVASCDACGGDAPPKTLVRTTAAGGVETFLCARCAEEGRVA